jgi:peroxin-11B
MEKIIAFSNKTEARDKFTKAIQYSAKIIAWSISNYNKSLFKRFNEVYLMTRDSRKIFRLFRSVQEIKTINDKIKDLLSKSDKFTVLCDIFSRIGYLIHWIYDNFFILAHVKIINSQHLNYYSYIAHMGWLVGILWDLLKSLYELLIISIKEDFEKKSRIIQILIGIVGKIGDLLPASTGVYLPEKVIGFQPNDGIVGLGGLISALIAMWGLWRQF